MLTLIQFSIKILNINTYLFYFIVQSIKLDIVHK